MSRDSERVAIMTFHDTVNYGGVLQCVALQRVVADLGYSPEVVDYLGGRVARTTGSWRRRGLRPVLRVVNGCLGATARRRRTSIFTREHYLGVTKKYLTNQELLDAPPAADIIIVGSDQVWNPHIIGADSSYFLAFAPPSTRKISYAASVGLDALPEEFVSMLANGIAGLDYVSVREAGAAELVKRLTGREATVVLDPTLMLSPERWRQIVDMESTGRDYILAYVLPGDRAVERQIHAIARKISEDSGLQVVTLGSREIDRLIPGRPTPEYGAGPKEFLSLLFGARYVVTNSFHGTALSVLVGIPFTSVFPVPDDPTATRSGRLESLLSDLNLMGRIAYATDHPEGMGDFSTIDIRHAQTRLQSLRESSLRWLESALSGN